MPEYVIGPVKCPGCGEELTRLPNKDFLYDEDDIIFGCEVLDCHVSLIRMYQITEEEEERMTRW